MQYTNLLLTIGAVIGSIGMLVGGIGYFINQFRTGGNEYVSFYKTENENLKEVMKDKDASNDAKFQSMSAEIGELRGQVNAEKANNERLEAIFQNRDPDTLKFQTLLIQAVTDQATVNAEVINILKDIHTMAVKEHDRDFSVTATVTKQ